MYVPRFNALTDAAEIASLVRRAGAATLITAGSDGYPRASLLPIVWREDRLIMHLARANDHWRSIGDGDAALAVVTGPDAYVSPAWYPSKTEHGRVVPTWNYSAVHFTGRLSVHHDSEWLLEAVSALTDLHERDREQPWSVAEAPDRFVAKQLKAIVGVQLQIERVEGKAKLSQNRSEADAAGVVEGLRQEGGPQAGEVAEAMAALRRPAGETGEASGSSVTRP